MVSIFSLKYLRPSILSEFNFSVVLLSYIGLPMPFFPSFFQAVMYLMELTEQINPT